MTLKIFLDADGVLIGSGRLTQSVEQSWDATIEQDLGIDREGFQRLFFGLPGKRSSSPMFRCVGGREDLKQALASTLPLVGYKGTIDGFIDYWFSRASNINEPLLHLIRELRRSRAVGVYLAAGLDHCRAEFVN